MAASAPVSAPVGAATTPVKAEKAAPTSVGSSTEPLEIVMGPGRGRAAVLHLRHQDAPGRQLLRL
jgi:hypothetical protein